MENRCCHIRLNGARCAMPALRNHTLCFEHDRRRRLAIPKDSEARQLPPRIRLLPLVDHRSFIENLDAIAQAFLCYKLDAQAARTLTYLMQTGLFAMRQIQQTETPVRPEDLPTEVVYDETHQAYATPGPGPMPEPIPDPPQPSNIPSQALDPTVDPDIARYFFPYDVPDRFRYPSSRTAQPPAEPAPKSASVPIAPAPPSPLLNQPFQTLTKSQPVTPVFPALSQSGENNTPAFKHLQT